MSKGFFINSHAHENKPILDNITQSLINTWNTVDNKSEIDHEHDNYITDSYNNTASGLTATTLQEAIDELKALIDGLSG